MIKNNKKIVVVGGGIAGLSVARDLALRGFEVIVIEKKKIGSGTTTNCAGMLHSGARYVVKDPDVARLCFQENKILIKIAKFAVGKNKALFLTLKTDDKKYHNDFEKSCKKLGIPINFLTTRQTLKIEKNLNKEISGSYLTPDVVVNTFYLVQGYLYNLRRLGVKISENSSIVKAESTNSGWELIVSSSIGKRKIVADFVVNATGDGLAETAKVFGTKINLFYIHGTMTVFNKRISSRIISHCAPSAIGDVIVPLGDKALVGSTWHELPDNRLIRMSEKDKKDVFNTASLMLKNISSYRIISSFTGIRTHVKKENSGKNFNIKRDYAILDHTNEGIKNFISVLPGKLTIARSVAEKVSDLISQKLGIMTKSTTSRVVLEKPKLLKRCKWNFYVN